MSKDGGSIGAENTAANSGNLLSSRRFVVRNLQLAESAFDTRDEPKDIPNDKPKDTLKDARPPSIWLKYVTVAEKWDRRMVEKWKANMNNLLIFVRPPHRKRVLDTDACQGRIVHRNRHCICPRRNVQP